MSNLEGILDYCREEGLEPVLITMPFTRYYNEQFSESFYRDFYSTISDVCERYDVEYLDYSHDPRFTENLGLFKDSNHLDTKGKEEFTRVLLSDLGLI